jgi:hypothetical protein
MPRLEGDVLVMPWNERYPVPVLPAELRSPAAPPPPAEPAQDDGT